MKNLFYLLTMDDALIACHEREFGRRPPEMEREDLLKILRKWESIQQEAQAMISLNNAS